MDALTNFKRRATDVHKGKYDYSLWTSYSPSSKNYHSKIPIVCPIHGRFDQSIANHLRGSECPRCGRIKSDTNRRKGKEFFIAKATKIHKGLYDYSLWEDVDNTSTHQVTIICNTHGPFKQTPAAHIDMKSGCPKCRGLRTKQTSFERYGVDHPKKKHIKVSNLKLLDDRDWLYEQHVTNKRTLINIAAEIGVNDTTVGVYMKKHNIDTIIHPVSTSTGEQQIFQFVQSLSPTAIQNNRTIISPLELDIYIPEHNLAIEYCGLYWHSERHKTMMYHQNKWRQCKSKGIQLLTVFEDEWKRNQRQIENKLRSLMNLNTNKLFARKCKIVDITRQQKKKFFDDNHIQGNGPGSINIGLTHNDKLVACMSFIKQRNDNYVLNRYATNVQVVGGFSKLLSHFTKTYNPKQVVSFADLRWSDGNLYKTTGWTLDKTILPDYYYTDGIHRYHKFNFRHSMLAKKFVNYDPTKTEHENCLENGWLQIYDCGKMRFILYS